MLSFPDDEPIIKNAIWKRLHEKGKTEIADIKVVYDDKASPPHIQVGVWFILVDRIQHEGLVDPKSFFDLPAQFTHQHLLNEVDEIAEQLKAVRRETLVGGLAWQKGAEQHRKSVKGNGLRGNWGKHEHDHAS